MVSLADIQKQTEGLSREDQEGLLTHLLHSLSNSTEGISDEEVTKRDEEMESGTVAPISHNQFIRQVRQS